MMQLAGLKWLFPAGAGVILIIVMFRTSRLTVPRRRGGDPDIPQINEMIIDCSPQARG